MVKRMMPMTGPTACISCSLGLTRFVDLNVFANSGVDLRSLPTVCWIFTQPFISHHSNSSGDKLRAAVCRHHHSGLNCSQNPKYGFIPSTDSSSNNTWIAFKLQFTQFLWGVARAQPILFKSSLQWLNWRIIVLSSRCIFDHIVLGSSKLRWAHFSAANNSRLLNRVSFVISSAEEAHISLRWLLLFLLHSYSNMPLFNCCWTKIGVAFWHINCSDIMERCNEAMCRQVANGLP